MYKKEGSKGVTSSTNPEEVKKSCIEVLSKIYDPELPLSIYDLGLVYEIKVEGTHVAILMTLTNPACPVAGTLPKEAEEALLAIEGVTSATVTLTWTPAWSKDLLSPEHQLLFSTFM